MEANRRRLADDSTSDMFRQLFALQAQAQGWLSAKGASEDSIAAGNTTFGNSSYRLDGVEVSEEDFFSGKYDPDTIVVTSNMNFYLIAREVGIWGDVNCSGEVDITDATWIRRKAASMISPFTDDDYALGDVDQSSDTDIIDAPLIQKYLTGMSTPYQIGDEIE